MQVRILPSASLWEWCRLNSRCLQKNKMEKKCLNCKRIRKIHAKGLCDSCYHMKHVNYENKLRINREWARRNLKYFRDYYHKNIKTKTKNKIKC